MESMLNKFKSTVTKVTADVTSAVMGNPVTREFEVGRHIASGGPMLSWKIFNGIKKSTKQEVAVFVFDKKMIEKYQKFDKDQIIDSLKRGVQQLTRLRHPRLLTVQHPLEESRDCLAFCTEPVFASLSNVLGQWDNLPSPVPTDIKEYKLYDVETKYGLLQISEGLSFLHNGVKMVHGNLTPENIILNKSGAWKVMGFDFSISSSNPSEQEPKYSCKEWDPNLPSLCLPNPEYLAPEYILSVSCDTASDMYSLGVVVYAVFNEGKPIFDVNKHGIFKSFSKQLDQLSRLSQTILQKIPEEVREHVKLLLNVTSTVRPDADQMTKYQKFDKDQIIDSLKRGVQQLTRLRHPRLLTVQHPLEESRDCLAFCTEPVFASLSNVLGQWDNLPSPVPTDIKEYKLYDVETKYGLLQISEGLSFLHNGVKMVHGNLTPENVILNKSGAWKVMGFDFSISSSNPSEQEPKYSCKEWDPNLPSLCLPNPEYLAPEYILSVSCDTASDMYSLGVVVYAVFNEGKPIFDVNKHGIFKSFSKQLDQLSRLSQTILQKIPEEVREHVKLLLNVTSTVRPDADQMTKIPFFDDVGAMTLQYFDSLFQRDNLQKSQFYKGLPKVLSKLPKRVVVQRILPALTSEFVNPDMVPFVLPNVLLIAEECSKEEYVKLILPDLSPVFKQQEPIQILLIFLQKMDLLLTKTPPEDIKNSVLPMAYRALEAPSIQIQVRVNSLVCLGKILEYLDKWFVIDEILPFLQEIPSREPAVLMGVLGIYKCTFTHKKLGITKEQLAGKVLPHLIPLSIDNNLNLSQVRLCIEIELVVSRYINTLTPQGHDSRTSLVFCKMPTLSRSSRSGRTRGPVTRPVPERLSGIYKCTFTHKKLGITKEQLAGKVLPHLIPLSIDNNLNLSQFNSFMAVIKDMLNRIEAEHKTKLEQLHIMQEQHRGMEISSTMNKTEAPQSNPVNQIDNIFGSNSVSGGSDRKENGSTAITPQPSRVSLTLEEKQRLAKQQEQTLKLKNQKPLAPSNVTTAASIKPTKDLTSTLLDSMSSMGNLSLSTTKPAPSTGFSTVSSMGTMSAMGNMSNGFNSSMGFQPSAMNMGMCTPNPSMYGGMATTTSTPNFNTMGGLSQPGTVGVLQQNKPANMVALDSLFVPQKRKVSLNQMAPKLAPPAAVPSPWLNQFGQPQGPQTMNMPMAPVQPGMMGQAGFGIQANPFFSPQNFSQPGMPKNTMKSSTSVNNDLKDLFG
ncbi:UNVERIFIED_CONTAM: hypothetical protein FKN15_065739 [Acipenser sinensis]